MLESLCDRGRSQLGDLGNTGQGAPLREIVHDDRVKKFYTSI